MKRVVVLGGTGFFGRLIAERLARAGVDPVILSRSRGVDANHREDLEANLRAGDLVIDVAGPFQRRTPALVETAIAIGLDVIDLSDSVEYVAMIQERSSAIDAAGIRVLTACSALSTVSAAVLRTTNPTAERMRVTLIPASRHTASRATITSFLASIDRTRPPGHGVRVKSVDSVTLPPIFAALREIELIVDVGIPGANALLRTRLGATAKPFAPILAQLARRFGPDEGVLAYEIDAHSRIFTGSKSYMLAVIPAIEAALAICHGRFAHAGLVQPDRHVDTDRLFAAIREEGLTLIEQ